MAYDASKLRAELVEDEGSRSRAYTDTRGNVTVGIGRNLTGKGLSMGEIDFLYINDVSDCCTSLDTNVGWWRDLADAQQRVMLNLCFNMGWQGLNEFKNFLYYMQRHEFSNAAVELQNSDWWHEIGERGPRMVARLLS